MRQINQNDVCCHRYSSLNRIRNGVMWLCGLVILTASLGARADDSAVADNAPAPVMEYRYWDWGVTPKRDDYQVALLTLALEKTRAAHGDFKIVRVKASFSTPRVRRELSRGKIINLQVGPWRRVGQVASRGGDPAIRIEIPLYKGLLGYRSLIIRREDEAKFTRLRDLATLKSLVGGQVQGWVDADIFRANDFRIEDSSNINTLLAMLNAKRYDYVSMSIVEAPLLLASQSDRNFQLMPAPRPLLYFPLPFVFYMSVHQPELAARLQQGLQIAQRDGSFDELFFRTFAEEIAMIKQQQGDYFELYNPLLPARLQSKANLVK